MSGKQEEERDGAQKNINRGSWKMNRVICAGIRQGTSSLQERKVDGIHKQGDEGHVDSPGHIRALLHVCMLTESHKGPTEFPHLH